MRRIPAALAALPVLALARVVPADGAGLWLRLAAATAVLLIPGALAVRALRLRGGSATIAWSLGSLAVALGLMFAVHGSLWLALAVDGSLGAIGLVPAVRAPARGLDRGSLLVVAAGVVFGIALWRVAGVLQGDALFHLGRVRKLDDFGSLALRTVNEFRDGGLHPGYAFPLWHGFLALVARLGGVDPTAVLAHEASVIVPLALLAAYEAGKALFHSSWLAGAVAAVQGALNGLAAGHGGAAVSLALPASFARQVLVFAVLALVFAEASLAAALSAGLASLALVVIHPTYAVFLLLVLAGYLAARLALAPHDLGWAAAGLGAVLLPTALVLAWLAPIVNRTASHNPTRAEVCRALRTYPGQLVGSCEGHYRLAAAVFTRSGAIAVAALAVIPLAAFAARRRWAAFVLGGSLAVLAAGLVPFVFPHFADAVSISQARRAAGFVPFPFALAGAAGVLSRTLRLWVAPLALGAGIAAEVAYPGSFGTAIGHGVPAWPVWVGAVGGALALILATVLRRAGRLERRGAMAAAAVGLFLVPVAVHGFSRWSPLLTVDQNALTPGLLRVLRTAVPKGSIVFSDLETSYRISAYTPLYVAAAPPEHVADTRANRPYLRRRDVIAFYTSGRLAIPRRYRAGWLVLDLVLPHPQVRLKAVYDDGRFALYRL